MLLDQVRLHVIVMGDTTLETLNANLTFSSPAKWIWQAGSPFRGGDINVGGLWTLIGLCRRQLFTGWVVMDVEACVDNLSVFLQKAVLGGAPVSVTFTLDLVSGSVCIPANLP